MNASKKVLTSILVTLGIIALVGCGVSKEEHEKAVSELNKTKADLAQAKTKMAEMERSLNEARAQLKSQAQEPSTKENPAAAEKPPAADIGMQAKLVASEKEVADLSAKVKTLTGENANLQSMLEKLKSEYAEIQKKLGGGVQIPSQQLPSGLPKKP